MLEIESACPFVAFDLETTGLFAETDRIVEVGAVRFDASGRELGRFERFVHPGRPMSKAAEAIHGISDAMLAGAAPARVVLPEFFDWLGEPEGGLLLAHNARFDAGFLGRELAGMGRSMPDLAVFDTLDLARRRMPTAPDHRLDTLARLLGLTIEQNHRALADSRRVMGVWLALADDRMPISYPVFNPSGSFEPAPRGWEPLVEAMAQGRTVCIEYEGGTYGEAPRLITPRRFVHKGGTMYLVAHCHRDQFEKSFRLDRVRRFEVMP